MRAGATPATSGASPSRLGLPQIQEAAQALVRAGQPDEACAYLLAALDAVLRQTQALELLVAKLRQRWRGTRSERVDPAQLALLFDALLRQGGEPLTANPAAEAQEDAALDRAITEAEQTAPTPARRRRAEAGWCTPAVERHVTVIEVPVADQTCATCQIAMTCIGVDVTHRLKYVPGHFVDEETHRQKWACPRCKDAVVTAPAPPQVLPRSAADASLLADLVVKKFADHSPLHRVSRIYARGGAPLAVSTLADWVAGVGDLVAPLVDRLEQRVLGAYVVGTDATGLKVLDPVSPEHIHRGTIWCLVGDRRDVLFRYTPTGEGETGPWTFLRGRTGYIQADASNVFDRLFNGKAAPAVELGCWSHARRRLVALQETDVRVAYPLLLIRRLYRIEHLADARHLPPDGRAALRQAHAPSTLDRLQRWAVATSAAEPPSSDLAQAAGYLLHHWTALTRFVPDGRVRLDNNDVEQQLRDVALGRKNYLFAGSHAAARRAAHLYSLLRTCAQYGVPPLPYLTDVLAKLAAGWEPDRLEELLPHRWQPG